MKLRNNNFTFIVPNFKCNLPHLQCKSSGKLIVRGLTKCMWIDLLISLVTIWLCMWTPWFRYLSLSLPLSTWVLIYCTFWLCSLTGFVCNYIVKLVSKFLPCVFYALRKNNLQCFLESEHPWSIWTESVKVLYPLVLGSMMCGEFRLITV